MSTSLVQSAVGDAAATAAFVYVSSVWEELGEALSEFGIPPLAAALTVVVAGLALFEPIGQRLGGHGASWNPATNACFAAAGKGSPSQHVVRAVAQALGGVGGAAAAFFSVPASWQGKFHTLGGGLRPGVSLWGGFACELALGFLLHVIVMWSISMRSKVWGFTTPLIATIFLVIAGMELTGPSLNPAVTFSWAVYQRRQYLSEHFVVFWLAPIAGGALAGWAWSTAAAPSRPLSAKRRSRLPPSKALGKSPSKGSPSKATVKVEARAGDSKKAN